MSDDVYLMMGSDGQVTAVDLGPMLARLRAAHIEARAAAIDPAAELAADQAFTAEEVREMWRRSGLSDDDLDSAANAALVLWQVEQRRE
jgi:hypothetical protein